MLLFALTAILLLRCLQRKERCTPGDGSHRRVFPFWATDRTAVIPASSFSLRYSPDHTWGFDSVVPFVTRNSRRVDVLLFSLFLNVQPRRVNALSHVKITQLALGQHHALCLASDGKVYSVLETARFSCRQPPTHSLYSRFLLLHPSGA